MKLSLAALCMAVASAAGAQDFAANSQAQSWGLPAEQKARFEAEVVDVLCTLTGDCPADCGAGARQLGLLRSEDGVLVLPLKNAEPFTGAVEDLLPHCGRRVEVDGLMIEAPGLGARNVYAVQRLRPADGGEWAVAAGWTPAWARANPQAAAAGGPWFRADPRIRARIAETGHLGLGAEADAEFLKEWFK